MNPKKRRVLIVCDISGSGAASWPATSAAINRLLEGLDDSIQAEIGLLGTEVIWEVGRWKSGPTLPARLGDAPSLVAPVLHAARAHLDEICAVVIVGSGEVFDLADWARQAGAWFLLQVGDQPLAAGAGAWEHGAPSQIERLQPGAIVWPNRMMSGSLAQEWALDKAGYPLVYVPPLKGFMHLFPVLRAQFEVFLASTRPPSWRDEGYAAFLSAAIPRTPAWLAAPDNYEGAFLGGALPEDILAFQAWNGPGYRPLSDQEWLAAWKWLDSQPPCVMRADLEDRLEPSARDLWHFALQECAPKTLLDLSFLRHGLIEWVKTSSGEWSGMGKPRQAHPFHNPLKDPPLKPTSLTRRAKWLGFRLMRKEI